MYENGIEQELTRRNQGVLPISQRAPDDFARRSEWQRVPKLDNSGVFMCCQSAADEHLKFGLESLGRGNAAFENHTRLDHFGSNRIRLPYHSGEGHRWVLQ